MIFNETKHSFGSLTILANKMSSIVYGGQGIYQEPVTEIIYSQKIERRRKRKEEAEAVAQIHDQPVQEAQVKLWSKDEKVPHFLQTVEVIYGQEAVEINQAGEPPRRSTVDM